MHHDWWLVPSVYLGISIVFSEAQLRRAEAKDRDLVFRPSLLLRLLYSFAAAAVTILLYRQWTNTEWWLDAGALLLLASIFFGWPKTIMTTDKGVECRWVWRKRVCIPWSEVEYAESGSAGRIEVVGANARIKFEGYNADSQRFRKELLKRGKLKSIADPKEFTGLHL